MLSCKSFAIHDWPRPINITRCWCLSWWSSARLNSIFLFFTIDTNVICRPSLDHLLCLNKLLQRQIADYDTAEQPFVQLHLVPENMRTTYCIKKSCNSFNVHPVAITSTVGGCKTQLITVYDQISYYFQWIFKGLLKLSEYNKAILLHSALLQGIRRHFITFFSKWI